MIPAPLPALPVLNEFEAALSMVNVQHHRSWIYFDLLNEPLYSHVIKFTQTVTLMIINKEKY